MTAKNKKPARKPARRSRRVPAIVLSLDFLAGSFLVVRITDSALTKMMDHPKFQSMVPPVVMAFFEKLMPEKRQSKRQKESVDPIVLTQPGTVDGEPN